MGKSFLMVSTSKDILSILPIRDCGRGLVFDSHFEWGVFKHG